MTVTILSADTVHATAAAAISGMATGMTVLTLRGAVPVEQLVCGDRVVTRSGARTLRSISVQRYLNIGMVHLPAGALGHERPEASLCLPTGQKILLRDWRAQAIYKQDTAAIPSGRLVDGDVLCLEQIAETELYSLGFDQTEVVYAEGLELICCT